MNTVRSIGRYRIEALLGTGAMGEVYRAHDPAIDRLVAIKVVRPELVAGSGGEQLLERFRREARAAGRRFHPNIVAIWDFGDDNGMPFLVMELVEGQSLDQLIKSSGPLAPRSQRRDHNPGAQRARVRSRERDRPPRHQTIEHHGFAGRPS